MINLQDFINWRNNEVTIEIFKQLEQLKQTYLDQILSGVNICQSEKSLYENIGRVNAYDDLLKINFKNLDSDNEEIL